jgi:hypothetical protein
MQIYFHLVD